MCILYNVHEELSNGAVRDVISTNNPVVKVESRDFDNRVIRALYPRNDSLTNL